MVPPLRGRGSPVSARDVVWSRSREKHRCHKLRSVIKFCDTLAIHCFQLARVVLGFFLGLCPEVEVLV